MMKSLRTIRYKRLRALRGCADEVRTLVALAVVAARSSEVEADEQAADYDAFLSAVNRLAEDRRLEAFEVAVALLDHPHSAQCSAGADLLGRLATDAGDPVEGLFDRAVTTLTQYAESEEDEDFLNSLVVALGHLGDARAQDAVLSLAEHPAAQVRWAVAWALPTLVLEAPPPVAVDALITLSRDENEDVRDWATFGLGSICDIDSEEVRAALTERLSDEHVETREEAIAGLAVRGDERAIDLLADLLAQASVSVLAIDTAADVGDPRLLPALLEIAQWIKDDHERVGRAIEACGGEPSSNRHTLSAEGAARVARESPQGPHSSSSLQRRGSR